jgi:hypothetical protein
VYDFVLKRLVAIILRLGAMQWPAQASGIDNATGQEEIKFCSSRLTILLFK